MTSRAKDFDSLRNKCIKRHAEKCYSSADEIRADIPDLAGVRIALYFPGERSRVEAIISRLFDIEVKKEFPLVSAGEGEKSGSTHVERRFPGYSAVHYRITVREDGLKGKDIRFARARVEVQVASVLMHGWSEVEHDLIYKPLGDSLSDQERQLIDQLNGLVHAGEVALELLQKAGQRRIEEGARSFVTHYELAAYLLSHVKRLREESISETEMGRVDVLFDFLKRVELTTPDSLRPHLERINSDFESRPLTDQIADAVIADNPDYLNLYLSRMYRHPGEVMRPAVGDGRVPSEEEWYQLVGRYSIMWAQLERIINAASDRVQPSFVRSLSSLHDQGILSDELMKAIRYSRTFRNSLIHGHADPNIDYLREQLDLLTSILNLVKSLLRDRPDEGDNGASVR
ncbi:hypothetical protein [Nocardia sp. NPDC059691]|uniref:hypothetical protein n=1 Tax=Nocardia sp. NPDC059691 TaxID=3346908 RepID=UPI00368C2B50